MTCPKRSEARRSNATRCRSYAPWQLSVNVLYKAKRGTQKVRIFRYIMFFCPKQMLMYGKVSQENYVELTAASAIPNKEIKSPQILRY